MTSREEIEPASGIEEVIHSVRGMKVVLDTDLARIYGVSTKVFNQAVKRNRNRFPPDFVFQLQDHEYAKVKAMRSQIVTASKRNLRFLPYAFTEHGAVMAANILNSRQAIQMSVFVVRAFLKMREQLLNRAELEKRLAEIEQTLMVHDSALRDLYQKIRPLLLPPPIPAREKIGFQIKRDP